MFTDRASFDACNGQDTCGKKRPRPAEQDRPDVAARREAFRRWIRRVDSAKLVFLDDAGANTRMQRSHAWTIRGTERIVPRPMNWGKNLTMLGAIRLSGPVKLTTQFDTANGDRFVAFMRRLAAQLHRGDIVVMDNARAHHDTRVGPLMRSHGIRVVYLPPYSPDFNPIEPAWANTKRDIKSAAPRDPVALRRIARRAFRRVRPHHCRQWFAHAGYKV